MGQPYRIFSFALTTLMAIMSFSTGRVGFGIFWVILAIMWLALIAMESYFRSVDRRWKGW